MDVYECVSVSECVCMCVHFECKTKRIGMSVCGGVDGGKKERIYVSMKLGGLFCLFEIDEGEENNEYQKS